MNKNDWRQINDRDYILKICEETIAQNPKLVKSYKKGKDLPLKFAIQKVANERANPTIVMEFLENIIK